MNYELNSDGYIAKVFFGCNSGSCTEYTGTTPENYSSLEEWAETETEAAKLNAWKIVDGNLVFDNAKYNELQIIYENQNQDNSFVKHSEIYDMQSQIDEIKNISDSQYISKEAIGDIIVLNDCKKCYPNLKFTNIDCYAFNKIHLIISGKNMLVNNATTQTIDGITFTQNKDRSIKINGTSTASIEYNIAGTSNNISPFLCFKKNENYILSGLENKTIKMYYYDGTDRTEVYSGTGGTITFTDTDKQITQIVVSIASGITISDVTIKPQLEYGLNSTEYETYKGNVGIFDFSSYIDEGLFPSDNLYPSDDLYPDGTEIEYVELENETLYIMKNGSLENEEYSSTSNIFDDYSLIYTAEPTNIKIEYSSSVLKVEDLEFIQGKATTTNKFKILSDGSIEATNGKFEGNITAGSGSIGGISIDTNGLIYSGSSANDGFGLWKNGTHNDGLGYIIFNAGGNAQNIGGSPFKVYQDGKVRATSGSIGSWNLSNSGIYGTSTAKAGLYTNGNMIMAGNYGMIKFDTTNPRITSASSLIISDVYDDTTLNSYAHVQLNSHTGNLVLRGGDTNHTGVTTEIIGFGGVYASSNSVARGKVKTDSGSASSLNTKENLNKFNKEDYDKALELLKNIDIYRYKYKYNLYENKDQYGFIIDYIEKLKDHENYFDFYEDELQEEKLKIKKYDSDVLDKYMLTCLKAMQDKIDKLEQEIKELKGGNK